MVKLVLKTSIIMKKSVHITFLFFWLILFLFCDLSCRKKYEEDPWTMRFVNLGKRIEGEWSIQKILIDGADSTSIIYVDSLQIFSTYIFSHYSRNYGKGSLEVRTHNDVYQFDGLFFIFSNENDLNTIGFGYSSGIGPGTNLLNNNIIPYGPIHNYGKGIEWKIHKLTKKEMHLSTIYISKQYELFFKKISK